jgi:hypothetical protein
VEAGETVRTAELVAGKTDKGTVAVAGVKLTSPG